MIGINEWTYDYDNTDLLLEHITDDVNISIRFRPIDGIYTTKYAKITDFFDNLADEEKERIFSMKIETGRDADDLYYGEFIELTIDINDDLDEETKYSIENLLKWSQIVKRGYGNFKKYWEFNLDWYKIIIDIRFRFYDYNSEPSINKIKRKKDNKIAFYLNTEYMEKISNRNFAPEIVIECQSDHFWFVEHIKKGITEKEEKKIKKKKISTRYTEEYIADLRDVEYESSYDPMGFSFSASDAEEEKSSSWKTIKYASHKSGLLGKLKRFCGMHRYLFGLNPIVKNLGIISLVITAVKILNFITIWIGDIRIEFFIYFLCFIIFSAGYVHTWLKVKKRITKKCLKERIKSRFDG